MRTDLPPEAFTKETLQEAFQWLQSQPSPVRASIHTPERLVSLYRKSQRLDENEDNPVSSKKFIDDLKNLATSLDEFSSPKQNPSMPPIPQEMPKALPTDFFPKEEKLSVETFVEPKVEPKKVISSTSTVSSVVENRTTLSTTTSNSLELDSVSKDRLAQVQKRFNLGSENEALRVLISLGFEKFTQLP